MTPSLWKTLVTGAQHSSGIARRQGRPGFHSCKTLQTVLSSAQLKTCKCANQQIKQCITLLLIHSALSNSESLTSNCAGGWGFRTMTGGQMGKKCKHNVRFCILGFFFFNIRCSVIKSFRKVNFHKENIVPALITELVLLNMFPKVLLCTVSGPVTILWFKVLVNVRLLVRGSTELCKLLASCGNLLYRSAAFIKSTL